MKVELFDRVCRKLNHRSDEINYWWGELVDQIQHGGDLSWVRERMDTTHRIRLPSVIALMDEAHRILDEVPADPDDAMWELLLTRESVTVCCEWERWRSVSKYASCTIGPSERHLWAWATLYLMDLALKDALRAWEQTVLIGLAPRPVPPLLRGLV